MICLLVETTTTIKISGRLYIHHLFLKRPLNARNNTRDNNAPKLIMAVILCSRFYKNLTHIMMMIATAVMKPLNNALLRTTSMKPKRKNPRINVNSPACNVITVATAIPTSYLLAKFGSVERRSWLYSCTACPISKLRAASGATLSCFDDPSSAYTRPGMEAEN